MNKVEVTSREAKIPNQCQCKGCVNMTKAKRGKNKICFCRHHTGLRLSVSKKEFKKIKADASLVVAVS